MFDLKLVLKSRGDNFPTVNTNDLLKAGVLKKAPKSGEKVELGLVNSGGVHAVQDFYASRDGSTLYAKEGFNDYLFDLPEVGSPTVVGCTGLAGRTIATQSASVAQTSGNAGRPTGLEALTRLINSFPTKVAAAASIGVSTDTLRRMLNKATEEAAAAAKATKRSAPRQAAAAPVRGGSQKKASAPTRSTGSTYSKTGITKTALKQALRGGATNRQAGEDLGWSADTIRRAREFFGL